jgi:2-oxoacid:acceptor oxidoreductase gamma subunit (pyruvate/2-ketoisovalerate family)
LVSRRRFYFLARRFRVGTAKEVRTRSEGRKGQELFEIRVHGLGGQGAVTLCTWVAQAGYAVGKHVQAFPFFGAERRGAPVKAFVRVDDEPIYLRSQVYHPDLLVVMSPDLTGLALKEGITPEGRLLVNAGKALAERFAERFSRDVYYLDATGMALGLGLEFDGMPMVNLPLFGAIVRQSDAASLDAVLDLTREIAARRGNAEAYELAVKQGWESVESVEAGEERPEEPAVIADGDLDLSRSGVTPIEP